MLGSHFYNQIVRKNIIAFGTLFNNITMKSTDPDTGEVLEEQKVPLAYGPKQKFLVRLPILLHQRYPSHFLASTLR